MQAAEVSSLSFQAVFNSKFNKRGRHGGWTDGVEERGAEKEKCAHCVCVRREEANYSAHTIYIHIKESLEEQQYNSRAEKSQ